MAVQTLPEKGEARMARKPARKDEQAKVDAEVLRQARIVCAYRGIVLAEYLSGILKPTVAKDLAEEQAKATKPKGSK